MKKLCIVASVGVTVLLVCLSCANLSAGLFGRKAQKPETEEVQSADKSDKKKGFWSGLKDSLSKKVDEGKKAASEKIAQGKEKLKGKFDETVEKGQKALKDLSSAQEKLNDAQKALSVELSKKVKDSEKIKKLQTLVSSAKADLGEVKQAFDKSSEQIKAQGKVLAGKLEEQKGSLADLSGKAKELGAEIKAKEKELSEADLSSNAHEKILDEIESLEKAKDLVTVEAKKVEAAVVESKRELQWTKSFERTSVEEGQVTDVLSGKGGPAHLRSQEDRDRMIKDVTADAEALE